MSRVMRWVIPDDTFWTVCDWFRLHVVHTRLIADQARANIERIKAQNEAWKRRYNLR